MERTVKQQHIRVLVGKVGLDGHDRGAKVLAKALSEQGLEVIYTGLRRTPEQIVNIAIQDDVDAILLSILSGAHDILVPKIVALLRQQGVDDKMVLVGGVIPEEDGEMLKSLGVKQVFGPGTTTGDVASFLLHNVKVSRVP